MKGVECFGQVHWAAEPPLRPGAADADADPRRSHILVERSCSAETPVGKNPSVFRRSSSALRPGPAAAAYRVAVQPTEPTHSIHGCNSCGRVHNSSVSDLQRLVYNFRSGVDGGECGGVGRAAGGGGREGDGPWGSSVPKGLRGRAVASGQVLPSSG